MAAKLLWAVLPVFVVLVVAEDASTTGFQPPSPSTLSTIELAPSSRVLATVMCEKDHGGVVFTLCDLNVDSCSYLMVFGKLRRRPGFLKYTSDKSVTKATIDNYNSWSDPDDVVPFQHSELTFEIRRREGRFMVQLTGYSVNWASEKYLGQGDAQLSVRPVVTTTNMEVRMGGYSGISSCETLSDEKCDGRDDESSSVCNVLAVYQNVTVKVNSLYPVDEVSFVLSNYDKNWCVSLSLQKINRPSGPQYMPDAECNNKDQSCNIFITDSSPPAPNENVFVVGRRRLELAVWLQSNPNNRVTVPLKTDSLAKLSVVSFTDTSTFEVTAPTVLEMLVELNDALRVRSASEPCIDDCLARLNSLVDMAAFSKGHPTKLTADEQWAVAWMRAAVASVSSTDTSLESTMTLAYKPEEYLEGLHIMASNNNEARLKLLEGEMASVGEAFRKNVTAKLEETRNYIHRPSDLPKIIESFENRVVTEIQDTNESLYKTTQNLDKLRREKRESRVLAVLLTAINSLCTVFLTALASKKITAKSLSSMASVGGVTEVTVVIDKINGYKLEEVGAKIGEVEEEITNANEKLETLQLLLPMLRKSKKLYDKLLEAVEKDRVRFWLTSYELQEFQAELIQLPIDNLQAATVQSNMLKILQQTARSLAEALDEMQTFRFQLTTVYLLTRPLHDDGPLVSNVTSLQQITGENTLAKEFQIILLNLRLIAFPHCGDLNFATAESCLSRESGSAMTQCVAEELNNLLSHVKSMNSAFRGIRINIQYFDVIPGESHPFYTWPYETHSAVIKALLSGEEVVLTADVSQSPAHQYGTKFEEIFLGFRRAGRAELPVALPDMNVKMVHSGVSHFRCAQGTVRFKHRSFPIMYSVHENEIHCEDNYCKLFRAPAKPMLSPYTTWTVQLTPTNSHSALQELANAHLDVLLVGKGTYAEGSTDCELCGGELMSA